MAALFYWTCYGDWRRGGSFSTGAPTEIILSNSAAVLPKSLDIANTPFTRI